LPTEVFTDKEALPLGTFSGPLDGPDKHLVQRVSERAREVCLCGHTAYLHGDRAIALCGGYDLVARKAGYEIPIRCNCKGFQHAEG
jgi:hypothetical protein